ncbi:hypothetical protein ACP3V3_02145 [Vibrio sp. PNB22_3_1]
MDKSKVIINNERAGLLVAPSTFGRLVDGHAIEFSGENVAKNFIRFLDSRMMIDGKIQTPIEAYFDLSEHVLCLIGDIEDVMTHFEMFLLSECSLLVEPYIDLGTICLSTHCDLDWEEDVSVASLNVVIVDRYRYFLHGGGRVFASYGMLRDDAMANLHS